MLESLLVMDPELRALVDQVAVHHSEGAKQVLKLVLKTYLKLLERAKSKGLDPLNLFQDLVERVSTGQLYRSEKDRLEHLELLLDQKEDRRAAQGSEPLFEEMRQIKNLIREIKVGAMGCGTASREVRELKPRDGANLINVEKTGEETTRTPESRANYRDVRSRAPRKKIKF